MNPRSSKKLEVYILDHHQTLGKAYIYALRMNYVFFDGKKCAKWTLQGLIELFHTSTLVMDEDNIRRAMYVGS